MADETTPPQPIPTTQSAPRTEPLAIWSLVLSILSWLGCLFLTVIPAIICGHVARSRIRKSNGALQGMNLALASLIVAYIQIPFGVLGGIMLVDMIRSDRVRLKELAVQPKEITSDDGKLKVTASGFWVKMPGLNPLASLQMSNKREELYLMVISDSKSDLEDLTLAQHHQHSRDMVFQRMSNVTATAPVALTVNGRPALQDEITGSDGHVTLAFLHTTVDDGDHFQQIVAWTSKPRWPKENKQLRDITNSFHSEK